MKYGEHTVDEWVDMPAADREYKLRDLTLGDAEALEKALASIKSAMWNDYITESRAVDFTYAAVRKARGLDRNDRGGY